VSRILHTKKSLKTASKRYPILAFLLNCVKGVEVVGVGENVFMDPFLGGFRLFGLACLPWWGWLIDRTTQKR
jgi:hypothetical protein